MSEQQDQGSLDEPIQEVGEDEDEEMDDLYEAARLLLGIDEVARVESDGHPTDVGS